MGTDFNRLAALEAQVQVAAGNFALQTARELACARFPDLTMVELELMDSRQVFALLQDPGPVEPSRLRLLFPDCETDPEFTIGGVCAGRL